MPPMLQRRLFRGRNAKLRKKNIFNILLILLLYLSFPNCKDQSNTDGVKGESNVKESHFTNPILAGDYPDPSLFCEGDTYYMTHSSFEYYPGLLIWKSQDLVHWTPVTHALHKDVGSVWAPDFIKYQDKYYIYFPADGTNWVVTADNPEGPWSDPVDLEVGHIDPGHVVADDGTRYLHLSGGHAVELTDDGLAASGEVKKVYEGWEIPEKWTVECFCLEAPKLTKKAGYYYLTSAEGGTAGPPTSHMVVSARSKNALGPWENSPYNPIVHTDGRKERWWSTGHGSLVEDTKGNWWIMFHGYEKGYHTLGRQTLMQPIVWTEDDWYDLPEDADVAGKTQIPPGSKTGEPFQRSDDFKSGKLGIQWQFFKDYEPERLHFTEGSMIMDAEGQTPVNSTPLLINPAHHAYEIEAEVKISEGAKTGLILFYNEEAFAGIGMNSKNFFIYRKNNESKRGTHKMGRTFHLKLKNNRHVVNTYFSKDGKQWQKVRRGLEVSGYHHNVFGGFLSLRAGIFAAGEGQVEFKNFEYNALNNK